ncbi:hypothetical protein [Enterobacter hormaechei]|uniref:hypothetical protein n=1 Tax=Enterobacter hormaechei TaxID=158836 RepID=UPI00292E156F|nr:hypothetical protein [Enterobacter hormaechei]
MKPSYEELEQKLIESERYGRQTDITIDNLEMKLAQMAAENAGLKSSVAEVRRQAFNARRNSHNCGPFQYSDLCDSIIDETKVETPATDAFLAEVRAAAVDEVCLKISNAIINCYQDEQIGLDAAATICGDFAAQLRKGVQS